MLEEFDGYDAEAEEGDRQQRRPAPPAPPMPEDVDGRDAEAADDDLVSAIIADLRLHGRVGKYVHLTKRFQMTREELIRRLEPRTDLFKLFKDSVHLRQGVGPEIDVDTVVQLLKEAQGKYMSYHTLRRRTNLNLAEVKQMVAAHPHALEIDKKKRLRLIGPLAAPGSGQKPPPVAAGSGTKRPLPAGPSVPAAPAGKRPQAPGSASGVASDSGRASLWAARLRTGEPLGRIGQKKNFTRFVEGALRLGPMRRFTVPQLHSEFLAAGGGESTPSVRDFRNFEKRIRGEFGIDANSGHVVRKAEALDLPSMVNDLLQSQPAGRMDMGELGNHLQKLLNRGGKSRPIKQFLGSHGGKARKLSDYLREHGFAIEGSIVSLCAV